VQKKTGRCAPGISWRVRTFPARNAKKVGDSMSDVIQIMLEEYNIEIHRRFPPWGGDILWGG